MNIKKKIFKNFFVQNFLAFICYIFIITVKITSKITNENIDAPNKFWQNGKPFILAFWHSQLMMISFSWKTNKNLNILASGHSDGRFGSLIGSYLNLKNINVSQKNKNMSLKTIFKLIEKKEYIALTPDGPRGPKEKVSNGVIKISKKNNIPIIAVGFASNKNFRLKSWDSFLITLPFARCSFVWSEPLIIPKNTHEKEIINFQKILEDKINFCVKKAEINCK